MSGLPLLVTMGDPAGIGIEITLKAWMQRATLELPPFALVGDPDLIMRSLNALGYDVPVDVIGTLPRDLAQNTLTIFDPKEGNSEAAKTIAAIRVAVELCQQGAARAVITNPIQKKRLYDAGFNHPGHTEYLAELTGVPGKSVMMLACPELKVVPATVHIPLSDVSKHLTKDSLAHVIRTTHLDLQSRFNIDDPKIVIAGMNPHAGESGSIGREEQDLIIPLIEALKREGISVSGPYPADSLFHEKARRTFDAAICMYHDQALIPIKTIDFDRGVNITLGLPIIRTSPDHGTADDIAGQGIANPTSLIEAIRVADTMSTPAGKNSNGR